jgi:hypothetical protein
LGVRRLSVRRQKQVAPVGRKDRGRGLRALGDTGWSSVAQPCYLKSAIASATIVPTHSVPWYSGGHDGLSYQGRLRRNARCWRPRCAELLPSSVVMMRCARRACDGDATALTNHSIKIGRLTVNSVIDLQDNYTAISSALIDQVVPQSTKASAATYRGLDHRCSDSGYMECFSLAEWRAPASGTTSAKLALNFIHTNWDFFR